MTLRWVDTCADHHVRIEGYLAAHEDADVRMRDGERQGRCRECNKWVWPRRS